MQSKKIDSITIFPFTREKLQLICLLKHRNRGIFFELVAPSGFGYVGKDAGSVDGRPPIGIIVGNDIDRALAATRVFFAADGEYTMNLRNKTLDILKTAIDLGKDIICDIVLTAEEKSDIESRCYQKGVTFFHCNNEYSCIHESLLIKPSPLYTPNIPIVFVAGLLPKLNEVDVITYFTEVLENRGYNVSIIMERPCGLSVGAYPFPRAFFNSDIDSVAKIQYMNNFVKYIVGKDKPDMLIVQVPGGLMKYNDLLTNDFGVYAYMLSQAIKPDYSVLCVPLDRAERRYYEMFCNTFAARFDMHIDFLCMSNLFLDLEESKERREISYTYCSYKLLDSILEEALDSKEDADSIINERGKKKMIKHLTSLIENI